MRNGKKSHGYRSPSCAFSYRYSRALRSSQLVDGDLEFGSESISSGSESEQIAFAKKNIGTLDRKRECRRPFRICGATICLRRTELSVKRNLKDGYTTGPTPDTRASG